MSTDLDFLIIPNHGRRSELRNTRYRHGFVVPTSFDPFLLTKMYYRKRGSKAYRLRRIAAYRAMSFAEPGYLVAVPLWSRSRAKSEFKLRILKLLSSLAQVILVSGCTLDRSLPKSLSKPCGAARG
jgi:hypothetical protein